MLLSAERKKAYENESITQFTCKRDNLNGSSVCIVRGVRAGTGTGPATRTATSTGTRSGTAGAA